MEEKQTTENEPGTLVPPVNQPSSGPAGTISKSPKTKWLIEALVVVILLGAGAYAYRANRMTKVASTTPTPSESASASPSTAQTKGLVLNPNHDYGNKYADGILPVGDGKYTTTGPKAGYVYACSQYAQNLATQNGGAQTRGPWFMDNNTEYDVNKKIHVEGNVTWTADYRMSVGDGTRTITTNDLPDHPTGIFPILASDPAYAFDRNPNSIKTQSFTFALPDNPTYGTPSCMGGEVGVMTTGVVLFSGFDAGGRDAGAWEVQDECSGHPQTDGIYHYHTLSACIKDTSVHDVIGYALDGFPITGPQVGPNNILTTADLDACHGITSQINLDGKSVVMYHYVMTEDFPYSISCYRGQAINPPGQQSGSAQPTGGGQLQPPPPGQ